MVGVFGLSENIFVGKTMSSHTQYMHIVIFYITFICVRVTQYKYIVIFYIQFICVRALETGRKASL
jgi:hypothetical protein